MGQHVKFQLTLTKKMNRRIFLESSLLAASAISILPSWAFSHSKNKPKVKWGIATITWGDSYLKGIEEISTLGIHGIQIRGNAYKDFKEKPLELKNICKKLDIDCVILSGGNIDPNPAVFEKQKTIFKEMAAFIKSIGGEYLQATTIKRDSYPPGKEQISRLAKTINAIGEIVKEEGIELLLHNHMHQLCQTPEEVSQLLDQTDPKKVGFLLDIAHYAQGGGNPVEAILKYKKRLKLLHFKDLQAPKPNHQGSKEYNYQFMELGKGNQINMTEVLDALNQINFKGWCMIELDAVPNPNSNPLEATKTSLNFLSTQFGYKF